MIKSKYIELNSKEWLHNRYCIEQLSAHQIGYLLGVDTAIICYHLKKFNIKLRNKSEALSGNKNPMYGKKHTKEAIKKIIQAQLLFSQEEIVIKLEQQQCNLINEYGGMNEPLAIFCNKCLKTTNVKQAKNIFRYDIYCKYCRKPNIRRIFNNKRVSIIERCNKICLKLNIIFLDSVITNVTEYHNFKCEYGHKFYKPLCELIRSARLNKTNGCRQCVIDKLRMSLDNVMANI